MKKKLQQVFVAIVVAGVATSCASRRGAQPLNDGEDPGPGQAIVGLGVSGLQDLVYKNGDDGVRKAAKLTMVPTSLQIDYVSISQVTCNATVQQIYGCADVPAVTWTKTTLRKDDELKLAKFDGWIYAWNVPDDGDFHVIVGDQPTFSNTMNLINIEIAALPFKSPKTPQEAQLNADFKNVRVAFMNKVSLSSTSSVSLNTYQCTHIAPIPVRVWGGPFWDYQHAKSKNPPGTATTCKINGNKIDLTVKNAWEIHPVTVIQ
jgi:hypothetical protein